ncbi:hypothetical protein VTP01DRAFT_1894 [Rhizomucor pusillus]|uniref:mitochondrial 37S ribosomal protein uS15m n=1 Tax=Rhizomucor pusillus TaxID=4840 RepID=UPI0037428DD9
MLSRVSSRLTTRAKAAPCSILKHDFHVSAVTAKKHPGQIKKENLLKRAARKAEFEKSRPSPILSKPTPFFNTLHTPASAFANQTDTQHFLTDADRQYLYEQVPRDTVEKRNLSAVEGFDEALKNEEKKVETIKKIIGLQNANAKAVQLYNIQKAIDWFKRKEGDTGSPEVEAAILTVRILNLHSHMQQHRKDKHNYKQLREMVHKRARVLKYLKRKSQERYYKCLEELGLEPRAVEGEITM